MDKYWYVHWNCGTCVGGDHKVGFERFSEKKDAENFMKKLKEQGVTNNALRGDEFFVIYGTGCDFRYDHNKIYDLPEGK